MSIERELLDRLKARVAEAIDYCEPHVDQMWAATIIGLLLDVDFRDAKITLEEMKVDRENERKVLNP